MDRARPTIFFVLVVAACVSACASASANKRSSLVALLPDPEKKTVGRAVVENKSGEVDLANANAATRVRGNNRLTVTTLTDAEVEQNFGEALAAIPPPSPVFVLHFRFESDELTPESRGLLPQILKIVRQHPLANVVVTGHTDTMGTPQANYQLGLKRATFVRNRLIAAGLAAERIEVSSLGESDPLIRTRDETAEPRNRRVDIAVR
jgi:outer membrane protein OmpA-like peptidoglycan-associated protein